MLVTRGCRAQRRDEVCIPVECEDGRLCNLCTPARDGGPRAKDESSGGTAPECAFVLLCKLHRSGRTPILSGGRLTENQPSFFMAPWPWVVTASESRGACWDTPQQEEFVLEFAAQRLSPEPISTAGFAKEPTAMHFAQGWRTRARASGFSKGWAATPLSEKRHWKFHATGAVTKQESHTPGTFVNAI